MCDNANTKAARCWPHVFGQWMKRLPNGTWRAAKPYEYATRWCTMCKVKDERR